MSTHAPDARRLLDDRGYTGPLLHGKNPATLLERGVVDRITDSYYYKEQCFGLNAATLCDRAVELSAVGGTYGDSGKPTPFLCLVFVALTIVPEEEIVRTWLEWEEEEDDDDDDDDGDDKNIEEGRDKERDTGKDAAHGGVNGRTNGADKSKRFRKGHFKYLRALAAFYIRLAWKPEEIYQTLEPLLWDNRKLRQRTRYGYKLTYIDQFVDDLLTKDRVCATSLWKLPPRSQLEDLDLLQPYESPIQDELDELDEEVNEEDGQSERSVRSRTRSTTRSRSPSYRSHQSYESS
jgi:pre-mRNA-splicing factor 38A